METRENTSLTGLPSSVTRGLVVAAVLLAAVVAEEMVVGRLVEPASVAGLTAVEVAGAEVEVVGAAVEVAGAAVEVAGAAVEVVGAAVEVAEAEVEVAGALLEVCGAPVVEVGPGVVGGEVEVTVFNVDGITTPIFSGIRNVASTTEDTDTVV